MKLTAFTLNIINAWATFVDTHLDPDKTHSNSSIEDTYVVGTLRLWHRDGWSPGYFTNEAEDFWVFVESYLETGSRDA